MVITFTIAFAENYLRPEGKVVKHQFLLAVLRADQAFEITKISREVSVRLCLNFTRASHLFNADEGPLPKPH